MRKIRFEIPKKRGESNAEEISLYFLLKKCKKKGENASPASVHAFSKTTVITWLDADNSGDDFSVGIGGPTPEP